MKRIKFFVKFIIFLLGLWIIISFKTQESYYNKNNIIWYQDLVLNKSMFKMRPPDENRPELAMISCGVNYDYEIRDNLVLCLKVFALMDYSKSWMKDSSKLIIMHERTHFDISELYARIIRRRLSELLNNKIKSNEKIQ